MGVSALNPSIPFQSPNNTQHSPQQNAADQLELTNETDPALSTLSSEQPSVGESLVDQLLNDKENNDIAMINTENPTTVMPSPTLTTSSTIEQSKSTSSQVSSNLSSQSTSIKYFFLELMKTKTPQSKKRGRSVASMGETLTDEEALRRQKETEDNKRRKEEEKEERKRIRMEKKEQKKREKEEKESRKRKAAEGARKSNCNKRRAGRQDDEAVVICGICMEEWTEETEEEEMWIACEICNDWFHASCTDIDQEHASNIDYVCSQCT